MKEQVARFKKQALPDALAMLKLGGTAALDFLLPPRCAVCGERTDRDVGLCAQCWSDLTFITRPFCNHCGRPFEFHIPGTSKCAACLRRPPPFDRAFSPLSYGDASRAIILQFKHGDQLGHARLLAQLMAPHIAGFGFDAPLLLPVPLHARRIMRRRFNQAAELAKCLGKAADLSVDVLTLKRMKATPMQQGLNASQRRRNVRGAFAVAPNRKACIKTRDLILIDDVFTTGATVEACAKVLRRAGAGKIGVLTAARVVAPEAAII